MILYQSICFILVNKFEVHNMRKIIAVDFDGTLCEDNFPYIGKEKKNVIDAVLQEQSNGAYIILWTCRGGQTLTDALTWCGCRGLYFDAVNDNVTEIKEMFGGNSRKIVADEYWDDKSRHPNNIHVGTPKYKT